MSWVLKWRKNRNKRRSRKSIDSKAAALKKLPSFDDGIEYDENGEEDSDHERTIYDDYLISREVGRGAFSRVYEGVDKATNESVAIKVMAIEPYDFEMNNIVNNEIRLMRRIRKECPTFKSSLCQIRDVVKEEERICIVMEFLSGGELFDRIVEKKHYSEKDASLLMARLVRSVRALHKRGIVHRDLKPENFLFATEDEDSDIKIADFGLALCVGRPKAKIPPDEDPHQSVPYVGSPGYVAPEVLTNQQYGKWNDVWSLGVILYILLSGRAPFQCRTSQQQFDKIVRGDYSLTGKRWEHISSQAKDLVRRMLDIDVSSRISMGEILRHPWIFDAHLREATKHLGGALTDMRRFNDTRKMRVAAEQALGQAGTDLRTALMGILEKTTYNAGLTTGDIGKIIKALRDIPGKSKLNREEFVKLLSDLGFKGLPLEELFDTLARQNSSNENSKTVLLRTNNPDPKDDEPKTYVDIDEIVVGLSVIVAKESRERALQYAFDFLSDYHKRNKTKKSTFARMLQVLSSYQTPTDNKHRRRHIANNIASIFSKVHEDDEQISFERFKSGVIEFGDDVLQDFFFAPISTIVHTVESIDRGVITNRAPYKSLTRYVSKMMKYSKGVNQTYNPAAEEPESEDMVPPSSPKSNPEENDK